MFVSRANEEFKRPQQLNLKTNIILFVCLYFMYSSTFLTDYLMNDELSRVGEKSGSIFHEIISAYLSLGRGFHGLFRKLVFDFAGYDPALIQLIRFVNFASIAIVSILLLRFLESSNKSRYFGLFLMLFWLSQSSFQGLMGYSFLIINDTLPSIWLSLLAFYLFFFVFDHKQFPRILQAGSVFLILLLAMQGSQTYAFFSIVPMSYLALTDWDKKKKRIFVFLLLAYTALLLSTIAYKIGINYLHETGMEAYKLGEQGMTAITSHPLEVIKNIFNPLTYWSAFEIWTYPFLMHRLSILTKRAASMIIMVFWLALIFSSIVIEFQNSPNDKRRGVLLKWLAVLFCFGLGAVIIVSDSPLKVIEHRPHILLIFNGLVLFSGGYSIQILASKWTLLQNNIVKILAGFFIIMTAFGAQAGISRSMVNNRMKQIDFIRMELIQAKEKSIDTVIVVVPSRNGCLFEPCGPWMGKITDNKIKKDGVYRYALLTIGVSPSEIKFIFVQQKPSSLPENSALVDWNKYTLMHLKYGKVWFNTLKK